MSLYAVMVKPRGGVDVLERVVVPEPSRTIAPVFVVEGRGRSRRWGGAAWTG